MTFEGCTCPKPTMYVKVKLHEAEWCDWRSSFQAIVSSLTLGRRGVSLTPWFVVKSLLYSILNTLSVKIPTEIYLITYVNKTLTLLSNKRCRNVISSAHASLVTEQLSTVPRSQRICHSLHLLRLLFWLFLLRLCHFYTGR